MAERRVYIGKVFSYQPNAPLIPEEQTGSSKGGRDAWALLETRRLCHTAVRSLASGNYLEAGLRAAGRDARRIKRPEL